MSEDPSMTLRRWDQNTFLETSQARWFRVGLSDELGVSRAALGWAWSEDELLKDGEEVSNHLEALEKSLSTRN